MPGSHLLMPLTLGTAEPNRSLDEFLHREGYEPRERRYCRVERCWCGSAEFAAVAGGSAVYQFYQRCCDCGCLVLRHVLPQDGLAELYGLRYFREHQIAIGLPSFQQRYESDAHDRIPVWIDLLRRIATGRRVIEVGCSHGRFVRELANLGYDVVGLELDAEIAAWARARTQLDIRSQRVETMPPASFDVFFANDVLEHVYAPRDFIAEASRVLVPGGRALFQTVVFRKWRRCPPGMLRPLYHTILYDASALPRLMPPGAVLRGVHPGAFGYSVLEVEAMPAVRPDANAN